jgi:hypothetical protein
MHFLKIFAGILLLLALGCQSQSELSQVRLMNADIPVPLRGPVVSMDMRQRDVRTQWLEVDKSTALFVLDPVMTAWLRYSSDKMWTYELRPADASALDVSQRIVVVQVMPVASVWDALAENVIPAKWRPVSKIELRRDGIVRKWVEVNRLSTLTPAAQNYYNAGYFGFMPECFIQGGLVELIVWRGDNSEAVTVPEALQAQLQEHFSIFDSAMARGSSGSSSESCQ